MTNLLCKLLGHQPDQAPSAANWNVDLQAHTATCLRCHQNINTVDTYSV